MSAQIRFLPQVHDCWWDVLLLVTILRNRLGRIKFGDCDKDVILHLRRSTGEGGQGDQMYVGYARLGLSDPEAFKLCSDCHGLGPIKPLGHYNLMGHDGSFFL